MTSQTSAPANEILTAAAAEVGLGFNADPFASTDPNFIQLQYFLNSAIKELARAYDWEFLVREGSIQTQVGESGDYALPDDFLRITDQTQWERNNRNPIDNLSAQQWQYLKGRDLVASTIRVKYRIQNNQFTIYPQPVTGVFDIAYEYISKNTVTDSSTGNLTDRVRTGADVPLFDEHLLSRMVMLKWLRAKGFDANAAQADVDQLYDQITGGDKGAPILDMGNSRAGVKLLNSYDTSDTNYGL